MCGIIGIASTKAITSRQWLADGRDKMAHRGPDGYGEWWSDCDRTGLAHRRLSIIDLSEAASQPFIDVERKIGIVFNGEIYNYKSLRDYLSGVGIKFKTESDTEVLLEAYVHWGEGFTERLNGMFAFAIYDGHSNKILLSRDRAGEKPLFYYVQDNTIVFGSEVKALLVYPGAEKRLNLNSLDQYLTWGYVLGEACMIEGFKKLLPGHTLSYNLTNGSYVCRQYYGIPELNTRESATLDQPNLVDRLEHLLNEAVNYQLVGDVPVAILLSGGLDSSIITALASRSRPNIDTFTIGFPGFGIYDETSHARNISNHFGTNHTELNATSFTADLMPLLAAQYDEPIFDSSVIPTYLVCKLVSGQFKVALGGDGGDELFGGYGHYTKLLHLKSLNGLTPQILRNVIHNYSASQIEPGWRGSNIRNWMLATKMDLNKEFPISSLYFDLHNRQKLMAGLPEYRFTAEGEYRDSLLLNKDIIQMATRSDFMTYLPNNILVKVDRASMINSLELRAPFLDVNVIDFAFSQVPSSLKATKHDKKILLKKVGEKILPASFDFKRKQGFSIPLNAWMKSGPFRNLFQDVLMDSECQFDKSYIKHLFNLQDRGYSNGERLFGLVMFELWRRAYGVSF